MVYALRGFSKSFKCIGDLPKLPLILKSSKNFEFILRINDRFSFDLSKLAFRIENLKN